MALARRFALPALVLVLVLDRRFLGVLVQVLVWVLVRVLVLAPLIDNESY